MKCPYCEQDMEPGYVQSYKPVFWVREKRQLPLRAKKDDILIYDSSWDEENGRAYLCRACGKMIVALSPE